MKNVGESESRNQDFAKSFSRTRLIQGLIDAGETAPTIFDVGAHEGQSIQFLRGLFPASRIHSFEPDPASFERLTKWADERTRCHNLALSDASGQAVFYRNNISHTNSLYRINMGSEDSIYLNKVRNREVELDSSRFNQECQVHVQRLDEFCGQHHIDRIALLKIDVQGAEARVLAGAGGILPRIDNVILEVSFYDYYEHQSSFLEIEQLLVPAGLRLFSISEISNNPMNGRTDWAEVIYRRRARQ
jgi:FkbM family methyltransferase